MKFYKEFHKYIHNKKFRIRFAKVGDIRFISHHDLMKVFERALRRAAIPIAMSRGFNPHPKMSFPIALSVGVTGLDEVMELELQGPQSPDMLVKHLRQQLPEEIQILSAEGVPQTTRSSVCEVTYVITFKKNTNSVDTLTPKAEGLLQRPEVIVYRAKKGCWKAVNIRPSIKGIKVTAEALILSLKMTPEGMARPAEVIEALQENNEKLEIFEITRTEVKLTSSASQSENNYGQEDAH